MKNMCGNKIIFNNVGLDINHIRILAVYESKIHNNCDNPTPNAEGEY